MSHHIGIVEVIFRTMTFNLARIDIDHDRDLTFGEAFWLCVIEPAEAEQDASTCRCRRRETSPARRPATH